jgi:hypothetical protein
LDQLPGEIKAADDRAKKALLDTSRISDELRSEQEHSAQIEKIRKSLEIQVKELTIRVEEAECCLINLLQYLSHIMAWHSKKSKYNVHLNPLWVKILFL